MLRDRAPKGIETSSPRRRMVLSRQTQLYQLVCDAIRSLYGDNVSWIDGAEPIPEQVRRIKATIPYAPQQETVAAATYGIIPSYDQKGTGEYASTEIACRWRLAFRAAGGAAPRNAKLKLARAMATGVDQGQLMAVRRHGRLRRDGAPPSACIRPTPVLRL